MWQNSLIEALSEYTSDYDFRETGVESSAGVLAFQAPDYWSSILHSARIFSHNKLSYKMQKKNYYLDY